MPANFLHRGSNWRSHVLRDLTISWKYFWKGSYIVNLKGRIFELLFLQHQSAKRRDLRGVTGDLTWGKPNLRNICWRRTLMNQCHPYEVVSIFFRYLRLAAKIINLSFYCKLKSVSVCEIQWKFSEFQSIQHHQIFSVQLYWLKYSEFSLNLGLSPVQISSVSVECNTNYFDLSKKKKKKKKRCFKY